MSSDESYTDAEWLTITGADAHATMVRTSLNHALCARTAKHRDDHIKAALKRARHVVDILERGDGKGGEG